MIVAFNISIFFISILPFQTIFRAIVECLNNKAFFKTYDQIITKRGSIIKSKWF